MAENIYQLFGLDSREKRGQIPMGDFLLELIKDNCDRLKSKYKFLRYLNIFNRANSSKASRFSVQVYVDFIHDQGIRVTNDRNEIQIGKPAGFTSQPALKDNNTPGAGAIYPNKSITIGRIFHFEKIFGESFEYVLDYRWNRLLMDPYYVTFTENERFDYSPSLSKVFSSMKNVFSSTLDNEILSKVFSEIYNDSQTLNDWKECSFETIDCLFRDYDLRFKRWLQALRYCYSNNGDTDNGTTHFFFFNGPIYYGDGNSEKKLADLVVDGNVGLTIRDEKDKENARKFLHEFRQFITQASFNLLVEYMNERLTETAVRASIAQVMARNMSHNFGSHVLSNLIGDDVYDKLRDVAVKKDLEDFERYTSISEWDNDVFKNDGKNRQLPFFFQYLKSRMDYLSEVTFGVSNLQTIKMMRSDVMKELDQVRILLNYISGVSNFKYIFKLQLPDNDIGVAFPSDVLGCQAFYNIIENIIRNTAKHAKNNNGERVTFTITIKDDFAEEADCEDIEDIDELYCVEIDNGVAEDNIDMLVNGGKDEYGKEIKGQNNRLNDSVLEGQNLRSSSLGLLEMEASAAFLRQIDLPEIESDDYTVDYDDKYYHIDSKGKKQLNILKAFAIDEKIEERTNDKGERIEVKMGKLGYRFFLQKPKEFLLVGEWGVTDEKKKQLLNCGIQFIKEKEFCQAMKAEKSFAHRFLIYQEDISEDAKSYLSPDNDCKTLLPLRRLSISNKEWETISKEWHKLAQQDDKQNKSDEQKKKLNGKDILLQLKKWAWEKYNGNSNNIIICGEAFKDSTHLKQIVFLDHGDRFEDALKTREDNMENGGKLWIENLSSRTSGKLPRFVELSTGSRKTQLKNYIKNIENISEIKAEIFEAYYYRVIVLDERIQKFSYENTEGSSKNTTIKIPCSQLFKTTDVLIPDTPLDPNSFSKERVEELERFVDSNITTDVFILVHYGVLERMYGEIKSIDDKLTEWAAKARRVVVTSGRGAHSLNLPKTVCFVNLSSALYAFCENRNKYIINNLLNQSRRKRNE